MTATITIQELFTFILYLLGIGLLVYLILLIKNVNKLITKARQIVEENTKEIDTSLKQLPDISTNINYITKDVKDLVEKTSPNLQDLMVNASSITNKLDTSSDKRFDAIDSVSDSVGHTAVTIKDNINNVTDYIVLIMDVIDIIKNALKNR